MMNLTLRVIACAGITFLAWKFLGPAGIVVCAPLLGAVFAKPILAGFTELRRLMRLWVYRGVHGRYYSFKGASIAVVEGEEGHRWLRASDVRKVVEHFPRDEFLPGLFGNGAQAKGAPHDLWIQAEALLSYLAKSNAAKSIRFKLWLHKEVILPSEKRRAGHLSAR